MGKSPPFMGKSWKINYPGPCSFDLISYELGRDEKTDLRFSDGSRDAVRFGDLATYQASPRGACLSPIFPVVFKSQFLTARVVVWLDTRNRFGKS